MTNVEARSQRVNDFVILASDFFRHSPLVIRI